MRLKWAAFIITSLTTGVILSPRLMALDTVVWGGGNGRWEEAKWIRNGSPGLTALQAMGDNRGGRGGMDISIGGGAEVEFDINNTDTLPGDYGGSTDTIGIPPNQQIVNAGNGVVDAADYVLWRKGVQPLLNEVATLGTTDAADYAAWRARFGLAALGDFQPRKDQIDSGSLTIKEGALLWMDSHSDQDGRWSRVGLGITVDNGTFRRTHSLPSQSGGLLMFGYRNELLPNKKIEINVINGGRIENDGKMVFGQPGLWATPPATYDPSNGHNRGIEVAMTINNGTLDLTGGGLWPTYFGQAEGDLVFAYEYEKNVGPKNEKYSINFTGPGSIIVDPYFNPDFEVYRGGIFVAQQDSGGFYSALGGLDLYTPASYEDIWNLGILQANGLSGLDPDGPGGPLTGSVFSTYFMTTGTQFTPDYTLISKLPLGNGAGLGGVVPEPASVLLVMFGLAPLLLGRRNFVGQH